MRADLHLHTTASDGKLEPHEIVSLAIKVGLDVISITDHDSIDGVIPALETARTFNSLRIIPGVEISTDVPNGEIHILGYFIDYTNDDLIQALREFREAREGRALKMIAKLRNLGKEIKWGRVRELARGGSIGRPHIAQALLEAGHIKTLSEAFEKYIGRQGPAYVERKKLLPQEAVRLIAAARGLPVLAHPTFTGDLNLDEVIIELKNAGLVGIEVYYDKYTAVEISRLEKVAERYRLISTGGSDYHAFNDGLETMIGEALTPSYSIEQLFLMADNEVL